MKEKFAITQILFKHFSLMTKGNPTCKLYYVTTGKWVDDQNLKAVIDTNVKELKDLGLFEDVIFIPCDAQKIQKLFRCRACAQCKRGHFFGLCLYDVPKDVPFHVPLFLYRPQFQYGRW